MQNIKGIQLISGLYIWPRYFLEVWIIHTMGMHPRARSACLIIEYVIDIGSWLSIVAIMNDGQSIESVPNNRDNVQTHTYISTTY
jgi:hypothetical protein